MREGTATLIRREDYTAPAFWIRSVDLTFELDPVKTLVISRMQVERNADLPTQAHIATWGTESEPSGIYYVVLTTPTQRAVTTIVVVK